MRIFCIFCSKWHSLQFNHLKHESRESCTDMNELQLGKNDQIREHANDQQAHMQTIHVHLTQRLSSSSQARH